MVNLKYGNVMSQKTSKKSNRKSSRPKNPTSITNKTKKKKQKISQKPLSGCTGISLKLQEREGGAAPNPYSFACSLRCKHPIHIVKSRVSSAVSTRNDDWISEDIYKRYTETDSRPLSPDHANFSRRSASVPRAARSTEHRKCVTPEPETKQCQFHQRRVLILDLRRVKSVDAITRQNSLTTGTSIDSTYADDDNRSSSANLDSSSIFHQLSPRNLSLSRSTTPNPKATTSRLNNRRKKKSKERSSSPLSYERSSSPKILEGPSPRSQSQTTPDANVPMAITATRQKKLRRHGRKIKGEKEPTPETTKNSPKDKVREGSAVSSLSQGGDGSRKKEIVDDPHDTQMSAMSHNEDDEVEELREEETTKTIESVADLNAKWLQSYIDGSARSLHQVLNEQLVGTEWNSTEMECIDDKIKTLQEEAKKYETKFKAGNIRMKEDLWLSFPRTWSRSSATFGVPTDLRILEKMLPVEYVEGPYISISEPRKHLYSLVFHRYRTMENPTGKTITYNTASQRALTEVLGRPLTQEESSRLQLTFLQIESADSEVTESLFRGISAVCERVFGKYSLEDSDTCYTCLKYRGKDKTRCHKNQKNQIEHCDLDYAAGKIRDGLVQPQLAKLLQAVFDRG